MNDQHSIGSGFDFTQSLFPLSGDTVKEVIIQKGTSVGYSTTPSLEDLRAIQKAFNGAPVLSDIRVWPPTLNTVLEAPITVTEDDIYKANRYNPFTKKPATTGHPERNKKKNKAARKARRRNR